MTAEDTRYLDARIEAIQKLIARKADVTRCEVDISRAAGKKHHSDYMWHIEMRVMVPGTEPVYAENHAGSVSVAIDDAKEEIERQLRKKKTRKRQALKKGGAKAKDMLHRSKR